MRYSRHVIVVSRLQLLPSRLQVKTAVTLIQVRGVNIHFLVKVNYQTLTHDLIKEQTIPLS